MGGREQLYQTITLVVIILFIDFLERRRPGQAVDRRWQLPLNILALLVVIVAGEASKVLLRSSLDVFKPGGAHALAGVRNLPGVLKILLGIVLADLCLYWVHRAMHRPLLWRTHTFHHSIEQLWWLSGSRTSVTHLFLFAVPQTIIAYSFLDLAPWEAGVAFSLGVMVNIWIHANIRVDLGPLQEIFITPNYHRVHHGARGLSNKNLGFILTIWDRMFGSYVSPRSVGTDFALGFIPTRKRLFRMIVGL
jgi:sterol desaturase/sphingolipid hydroxylase (fatty acid hydroxylase superfamily)